MSFSSSMALAKEFGIWLYEKMNERQFSGGDQELTSVSNFQNCLGICDAIVVLLEARLPGPSLALARPLFEGYVRAFWLSKFASDAEISAFKQGNCPNCRGLLNAIGTDAEFGAAWIHSMYKANFPAFHGLTHGGHEHVFRRCTGNSVEPNYPEGELEELVELSTEI
ncbi:DUF6988 family protein [Undibacterium sp. Di27W]|uniref:DUF6988 family protein n=1 Tax=Undibacterium sp. Di27W TaxID=3413036 RepID=UPI003BEF9F1B